MNVVTLQHKSVLAYIQKYVDMPDEKIFPLQFMNYRNWSGNQMIARHKYFDYYNAHFRTDYNNFFWVFSSISSRNGMLHLSRIDSLMAHELLNKVGYHGSNYDDYYILSINLPHHVILETDFYDYCDSIFDIDLFPFIEEIFNVDKSKRDVQGIIPYIKYSWINEYVHLSDIIL